MIDAETIVDIVRKLNGPIRPAGDVSQDDHRFVNLVKMTDVVDLLLEDVENVACPANTSSMFGSVRKAGVFAKGWLEAVRE